MTTLWAIVEMEVPSFLWKDFFFILCNPARSSLPLFAPKLVPIWNLSKSNLAKLKRKTLRNQVSSNIYMIILLKISVVLSTLMYIYIYLYVCHLYTLNICVLYYIYCLKLFILIKAFYSYLLSCVCVCTCICHGTHVGVRG